MTELRYYISADCYTTDLYTAIEALCEALNGDVAGEVITVYHACDCDGDLLERKIAELKLTVDNAYQIIADTI